MDILKDIDLLKEFLPAKYGIGSGIIVDRNGKESKQIDIIIYDKNQPNYSLSKYSRIFLVDQVIAAIEVKTTYTVSSLRQALQNIQTVRELEYSQESWYDTYKDHNDIILKREKCIPSSPLGIIFFYSVNKTRNAINQGEFLETFIKEINAIDLKYQPDSILTFGHCTLFSHKNIYLRTKENQYIGTYLLKHKGTPNKPVAHPEVTEETQALIDYGATEFVEGEETHAYLVEETRQTNKKNIIIVTANDLTEVGMRYPTIKSKNFILYLDPYRCFIGWIYMLNNLLDVKKIKPNWSIEEYLPDYFAYAQNIKMDEFQQ
jgi:hypothetical protein